MRKNKKSLSLFLAILMVVTLLPALTVANAATTLYYEVLTQPTIGSFYDDGYSDVARAYGNVAIVYQNVYYNSKTKQIAYDVKPSSDYHLQTAARLMRYNGSDSVEWVSDAYNLIYEFTPQGYALVWNFDYDSGIINYAGELIVPFDKYDFINEPSDDGCAVAYNGKSYVLVDLSTLTETPITQKDTFDYYFRSYFSSGYCVIGVYNSSTGNEFYHYEKPDGSRPFNTEYSYASDFSFGRAGVRTVGEDVYKIINTSGETVISLPNGYWPAGNVSKEGIFAVSNSTGLQGYMDVDGNWITSCQYADANMFRNGYAVVRDKNWNIGMISSNGGTVIPFGDYVSLTNASDTNLVWAWSSAGNKILGVSQPTPAPHYTITATADPAEGGSVTGCGSHVEGAPVTLTAAYNDGYRFVGWKDGSSTVSTSATYTFTATKDQTLTAVFESHVAAKVGERVYSTVQDAVDIIQVGETIELTDKATVSELGSLTAPAIEGKFTISGPNAGSVRFSDYTDSDGYKYTATVVVNSDDTVTVTVTRTKVNSGPVGGGGGTSTPTPTPTTSSVTVSNPGTANGTVTANTSAARKGDTVTVTSKANSGYISAAPIVKDKNGNTVAVVKKANGTWSFTMPEGGVTITGSYVTPGQMFSDLNDSQWYRESIAYVVENGLMDGMGGGQFNPGGTTTRGMVMTILARQLGVDTTPTGGEAWYQKGMDWAKKAGVSDGSNPGGSISREQLATMLYRFAGSPTATGDLTSYPDAGGIHDWASTAMAWAVKVGIIEGSDGKLDPQGNATRAQAAAMLTRFCKYLESK